MNIMLLEDDYLYSLSIKEYLEDLGFSVDAFSDANSACEKIASTIYHLYILDIKVINGSGLEVLEYIKSLNINAPIMMMTSRTDIDSITKCYELGCNEYLKKPFELAELKFRINELFKQFYDLNNENKIIINQDYEYDFANKSLKKADLFIDLTSKEIKLIEYLLSNKSSFLSVESIYEYVWENELINPDSLSDVRVYVKRIRSKTCNDFIISSRGLGYKINV